MRYVAVQQGDLHQRSVPHLRLCTDSVQDQVIYLLTDTEPLNLISIPVTLHACAFSCTRAVNVTSRPRQLAPFLTNTPPVN